MLREAWRGCEIEHLQLFSHDFHVEQHQTQAKTRIGHFSMYEQLGP